MQRRPHPSRRSRALALTTGALLALLLSACGSTDTPTAKVASLTDTTTKKDSASKKQVTDADRQDAMLKFAACMRKHGIDMPDPKISSDGKGMVIQSSAGAPTAAGGPGGATADQAEIKKMDAANKACEPIMEAVAGDAPEMSPEDQARFRDEQLQYAKCMREHGVDMPDPQITFDGGKTQIKMGGDGTDTGQRIDPTSDTFTTATEACKSLLGDGKIGISAAPVGADGGGNVITSGATTGGGK